MALAGVKSPGGLCILLPGDMNGFSICLVVYLDIVQILETMQSSRSLSIPQISPGDNVESGIASIDPSDATLSDEFPCPDDYFDPPDDQILCVPSLDHDVVEAFDPYQAVQIISRILEDQQMLRFNCFGDFFPQVTISGPFVPVARLLPRVL
jgi:hypothetical protein